MHLGHKSSHWTKHPCKVLFDLLAEIPVLHLLLLQTEELLGLWGLNKDTFQYHVA